MRKVVVLFAFAIILCSISACSQNDLIIQKVDSLSLNDSDLTETIQDINNNLKDGVYRIEADEKLYIVFNGMENSYKDISWKTSGSAFEIGYSKEQLLEKEQRVYEVVLPKSIDTIKLLEDGAETAFKSCILK